MMRYIVKRRLLLKETDMIHVKQSAAFSAYHNYRYGDFISREIFAGSREGGFFLSAGKVDSPQRVPDIQGALYDVNGNHVADIVGNAVTVADDEYNAACTSDGVLILDKKGELFFGWNTYEYRNALITIFNGTLYNTKGELVRIL